MKVYHAAAILAALSILAINPISKGQGAKQAAPAAPANAVVERGRYIVEIGGCNDCHTTGYAEAGGKAAEADRLKGDALGYRGPWGTTYPTNLRLSIGRLTEDAWVKRAKTLETRPPMPWFNIRAMSDADLKAMYAYIKQLPGAAGAAAPAFLTPDKAPKQPFIQWPGVK